MSVLLGITRRAGGVSPYDVAAALGAADPYRVDVASGVEPAPRIEDHQLVRRVVRAAKGTS